MFSGGTESTEWFEVSLVTSSTTCVVIHATINTVLICPATANTQLFHYIKINGAEMTSYEGRPILPIIPLIVAVDHEREIILSVEATGATTETQVLAMPAQHTDSLMRLRPVPFLQNEDMYEEDEDYPGTTATMSRPTILGGIRCVHLDFWPVQQNPSEETIQGRHWLEKHSLASFKNGAGVPGATQPVEEQKNHWWWYRYGTLGYMMWKMINERDREDSPVDATLISGEYEFDGVNNGEDLPVDALFGNKAVIHGRDPGDKYNYMQEHMPLWTAGEGAKDSASIYRRVNGWNDGLGVLFWVIHGQKCMHPCWNRINAPKSPGCMWCLAPSPGTT